jgi:hypothetical protein
MCCGDRNIKQTWIRIVVASLSVPILPQSLQTEAKCYYRLAAVIDEYEIEEEIEAFYRGPYHKPVLRSKEFIGRVKDRLGDKARVEQEKPESRRIFGVELEAIVAATAREYGKGSRS